jgi:hypothetical protein
MAGVGGLHHGDVSAPGQYKDPTSIINYPNSMAMTEAFRIRGGKVTHIVAQMVMLPYRHPTG